MKIVRKIAPVLFVLVGAASLHADNPPSPFGGMAEMSARASQTEQDMRNDYREVIAMQMTARKQKDVIKLNCVNDKLIQIKAEMNIADSASQQLRVEMSVGGRSDRDSWYSQLVAESTRIRDLRQEAAACLGEIELSREEEGGSATHPDFPDDPTVIPFDVYTEPPAYASPYN